jgi:PncC family amidohydrolase
MKNMKIVKKLMKICLKNNLTIGTIESCTGGNIAHEITSLAGSSKYFKGSLVTYMPSVKSEVLKIPEDMIKIYTPESAIIAEAMSKNGKKILDADYTVSITGFVGPDIPIAPAGEKGCFVYIGITGSDKTDVNFYEFDGTNRLENIQIATKIALLQLVDFIEKNI